MADYKLKIAIYLSLCFLICWPLCFPLLWEIAHYKMSGFLSHFLYGLLIMFTFIMFASPFGCILFIGDE